MANISKKVIEDVRQRSDIVDVIGAAFTLQKAGGNFRALCPFHKEKTPSFNVNPQRQIFHCFGCGAGGDVFKFVQMHEGVDFITALRMLAEKAGIPIEWDEGGGGSGPDKDVLFRIHSEVATLYHQALVDRKSAAHAREYLEKRALTGDMVEQFMVGYSPNRWDAVLQWARGKKYSLEVVETAGLILRRAEVAGRPPEYYDRFRNRLMFPIRDEQGRVIGFSGRCLDNADKTAKYVNSPDSPLFHKSRVLYALDQARRNILETREAIICEGQIDVIRCHQAGFNTAVASQGTAFTEDHVRILRRYADSVVLVFDPDRAGQDAAVKTSGTFLQAGLAVRVAQLPAGEDPDAFIRERGADAFRKLLADAMSAVQFQVAVLSGRENLKTEVGVMRAAKAVLATVSHSPNAVQRAMLLQEAAEKLGLPPAALQEDLRRMARPAPAAEAMDGAAETAKPVDRPREQVELCEHLAHVDEHPALVAVAKTYLDPAMMTDPLCRKFMDVAVRAGEDRRTVQDVLAAEESLPEGLESFAAQVQMAPSKVQSKEYSREDAIRGIILFMWRKRLEAERSRMEKEAAGTWDRQTEEERLQLTQDVKALRRWETGAPVIKMRMG